jgi:hypothetical protein
MMKKLLAFMTVAAVAVALFAFTNQNTKSLTMVRMYHESSKDKAIIVYPDGKTEFLELEYKKGEDPFRFGIPWRTKILNRMGQEGYTLKTSRTINTDYEIAEYIFEK